MALRPRTLTGYFGSHLKKLRNKFERKLNAQLKKSGKEFSYESSRIPYILAFDYIPDWTVITPNGLLYIEAKGYLRPEHKRKMVAVKRQHPDKDIRIVFYSKSKANIRWADKQGYKYAVGTIPKEWLDGF